MRFWKSWLVTRKDLSVIRRNKYVFYSLIAMPLILGVIIPAFLVVVLNNEAAALPHDQLLAAFNQIVNVSTIYLVLIAAILPSIIASYSFVGEKVEKSLEPLLATPTTDSELLLGKSMGALIPCLGVTLFAAAISASILDVWSFTKLGVTLIPNLFWLISVPLLTPLTCILSVEANVIISSRVNDIRAAQQLGGLVVLPIVGLIFLVLTGAALSIFIASFMAVALVFVDVALFYLSKETFQREEILTKWK